MTGQNSIDKELEGDSDFREMAVCSAKLSRKDYLLHLVRLYIMFLLMHIKISRKKLKNLKIAFELQIGRGIIKYIINSLETEKILKKF